MERVAYRSWSDPEGRATSGARENPFLVDFNPFLEWDPGVEIEEESIEDIMHENDVDEYHEINETRNEENVGEGAYVTDTDSISEIEDSPQDEIFTALVNDFDDVKDRMDLIIEDLN